MELDSDHGELPNAMRLLPVALAAATASLSACGGGTAGVSSGGPDASQRPQPKEETEPRSGAVEAKAQEPGHPALGGKGAPVVLIEYGDYQ